MNVLLGAQGVGKTTLLNELSKKGYLTFESPSREIQQACIDIGHSYPQPFINAAQIYVHKQFIGLDKGIFARSIIDTLVWSRQVCELTRTLTTQITAMETLLKATSRQMNIYYIPIEFQLKGDKYRPDSIELQKRVDQAYDKVLSKFRFKNIYEIRGSIEERTQQMVDLI